MVAVSLRLAELCRAALIGVLDFSFVVPTVFIRCPHAIQSD
jgi:hypothetical protein